MAKGRLLKSPMGRMKRPSVKRGGFSRKMIKTANAVAKFRRPFIPGNIYK